MRTRLLLALAAGCAFAQPASAAEFVLDLNGTVASGGSDQVVVGNDTFDFFTIVLTGFTPFSLTVGDTVKATIMLDQSLTVPIASVFNAVDFALLTTIDPPGISTGTDGTTDLFENGGLVASGGSGSGSSDQLVNAYMNFAGTSFSFDKVYSEFTIVDLDAPSIDVDLALLRWVTLNRVPDVPAAVPEPATWAMMILGFGLIGAATRQRRRVRLTYA